MRNTVEAHKVQCQEVDDLLSRLDGISAIGLSLRPKRCGGTLSSLILGDISVQVLRSAPLLMLADATSDRTTLLTVVAGAGHARWDGNPLAPGDTVVCDPSRRHEAFYPDEFACLMLTFGDEANDRIASRSTSAIAGPRIPAQGTTSAAALRELDCIFRSVDGALAEASGALMDDGAACRWRERILVAAEAVLAPAKTPAVRPPRSTRARQGLVRAVDDYLREKPTRPVYTEELCAAFGVSATRLHEAFHATIGMSPHRYLKLRRMAMVRATLLSRSGPWHSVKAAALSHGFWHLGQFAHDYWEIYGERPSETLARTGAITEDIT